MAGTSLWLRAESYGLYVAPADCWIDPSQPVGTALVTHGHADHARGGHRRCLATPETLAIMALRYGGKAQRLIAELRRAGYGQPIWLHGALEQMCRLYEEFGVDLGPLQLVSDAAKTDLTGQLIICPPGALNDRWSRRLHLRLLRWRPGPGRRPVAGRQSLFRFY